MRIYNTSIEPYNADFTLLKGNFQDLIKWSNKLDSSLFEDIDDTNDGLSFTTDGSFYIWLPDDYKLRSLVHETAHIGFFILDWVDIPLFDDKKEAFTYLQAYIFDICKQKLDKWRE